MMTKPILIATFSLLVLAACSLERDVDVNLPEYENQLVVECYLEPGERYKLLLMESFSYFEIPELTPIDRNRSIITINDGIEIETTIQWVLDNTELKESQIPKLPPSIDDATVTINHLGETITLENQLYVEFDPRIFEDSTRSLVRFYNFVSPKIVPFDFDNFELNIADTQGRTASSQAKFLPLVPIDSSIISFNADSLASYQLWFTDPAEEDNYYRRTLNKQSLFRGPNSDFATDDRFFDGAVLFNNGFDFKKGDLLISTFYHIDEAYYDFLTTLNEAEGANGNPFGQPAVIKSNIEGGIGIFTALSYVRETVVIE